MAAVNQNDYGINLGQYGANPFIPGSTDAAANTVNGIVQNINGAIGGAPATSNLTTPSPYAIPVVQDNTGTQAPANNGTSTGGTANPLIGSIDTNLNRLGTQSSVGNQNILDQYNQAYQQLVGQRDNAITGLNNTRNQTQNDDQTALDNIGSSVRNTNTGLQRLLGAHGAGNSSAASILAPFAAAQQGAAQRGQVQTAYGKNMANIDNSIANTGTQFDNGVGALGVQRDTAKNALQSNIDNIKAGLLAQRNGAGDQTAVNALLGQIDQLGLNPTFTPAPLAVASPDIAKYDYTPTAAPAVTNAGAAATQAAGPFWGLLNGQDKQKQLAGQGALAGS